VDRALATTRAEHDELNGRITELENARQEVPTTRKTGWQRVEIRLEVLSLLLVILAFFLYVYQARSKI
jgi:uncharacterized protein YdcH (DUF465 family)